MSETLSERNYRSVATEIVTHFSNEMELKETTIEIIKSLEFKLVELSKEYEEGIIMGALDILKNSGEPIGNIVLYILKDLDLKENLNKKLN